jgi:uncharacterized protein (DUF58 family)
MLPESFTPQFLRQLELLNMRSKRAFLGARQGGHLSLKRGHGLEFSDYRQYELGDHPRSIDWGVYARSERLYVKRFQEEQDIAVLLILDASASMNTPDTGEKWQRAKEICLALSYVALMQQDSVTLAGLGKKAGPTYHGMKSVQYLAETLSNFETSGKIDLQREIILAATRVRFPGVAIFISDFLMPFEEIQKAFTVLRSKNLDITAIQILSEADIQPFSGDSFFIAVDSESNDEVNINYTPEAQEQYKKYMDDHWQRLSTYFKNHGINSIQLSASSSISELVVNKLSKIGLLR